MEVKEAEAYRVMRKRIVGMEEDPRDSVSTVRWRDQRPSPPTVGWTLVKLKRTWKELARRLVSFALSTRAPA